MILLTGRFFNGVYFSDFIAVFNILTILKSSFYFIFCEWTEKKPDFYFLIDRINICHHSSYIMSFKLLQYLNWKSTNYSYFKLNIFEIIDSEQSVEFDGFITE